MLCKPPTLIPRPETEELVDYILKSNVLQNIVENQKRNPVILDIGAGTGVIGIALAKYIPTAIVNALDIKEEAVNLLNENAKLVLVDEENNLMKGVNGGNNSIVSRKSRYECRLQNFLDFSNLTSEYGLYDIIVSNPPYIPSIEMITLQSEVGDFEDHTALHGGEDGMDMIRDIILHSKKLLNPGGPREVWLEVSREHPAAIELWLMEDKSTQKGMFEFVESIVDMSGHPRFVRLRAV